MSESVKLIFNDHSYELPLIQGSEGEQALDISALRRETGLVTYDPGYPNTGSCKSKITFMDGEQGILRYRGIPIEQLAEHSTFIETAYLLIYGELPTRKELTRFSVLLNDHSLIHRN
ncbi:MAG: citrate/2-methylcitrate synthase, partial [Desulfohalobiaceae bacterium]